MLSLQVLTDVCKSTIFAQSIHKQTVYLGYLNTRINLSMLGWYIRNLRLWSAGEKRLLIVAFDRSSSMLKVYNETLTEREFSLTF